MKRFLVWLGQWCFRRARVQSIACTLEDKRPQVVVLVLVDSALVPAFIVGALKVYCGTHGVPVPDVEPIVMAGANAGRAVIH